MALSKYCYNKHTRFDGMSLYIAVYIQKSECIQAQSQEIEQCVERQKDVTVSREAGAVYNIDKDEHQYVKDVCG